MGEFKKYSLDKTQLTKIARLCVQEQGNKGAPYEASLMCNLYELKGSKKYSSLYDYVRNGGWFSRAAYFMDNGTASSNVIESVENVVNKGHRLLPRYVDEHDCFNDIVWVKNNGKEFNKVNRFEYIPHLTVIKNRYGSLYTFYSFPTQGSDPFGYTDNKYAPKEETERLLMCIGNRVNFRTAPSMDSDIICMFDEGDSFYQLGVSGVWVKIKYNDVEGYIHSKYVCDVELAASNILTGLQSTYSVAEIRTILRELEKLVN